MAPSLLSGMPLDETRSPRLHQFHVFIVTRHALYPTATPTPPRPPAERNKLQHNCKPSSVRRKGIRKWSRCLNIFVTAAKYEYQSNNAFRAVAHIKKEKQAVQPGRVEFPRSKAGDEIFLEYSQQLSGHAALGGTGSCKAQQLPQEPSDTHSTC